MPARPTSSALDPPAAAPPPRTTRAPRALALVLAPALALLAVACGGAGAPAHDFPEVDALPEVEEPPDPFIAFWGGRRISDPDGWRHLRRPELALLFQHYVYGFMPAPPERVAHQQVQQHDDFLAGAARYREVEIELGPAGAPRIALALFLPAQAPAPAPVVLILNSCGNQRLVADPRVSLSRSWLKDGCNGAVDNKATEASRGRADGDWMVRASLARGYALATFHQSDVAADDAADASFSRGIFPFYDLGGDPRAHWGALSAWAWGLQRAVDYLVQAPAVDSSRIIVAGHSRQGKAALWAGALDERIALVAANQTGTGGATLSRSKRGEPLSAINALYPHWFDDIFVAFANQEARLPIDQHLLLAMVAPRPLLLLNAEQDLWSDPPGALAAAKAADAVYELLGSEGLKLDAQGNAAFDAPLGWHMRPGAHDLEPADWETILDFADAQLGR